MAHDFSHQEGKEGRPEEEFVQSLHGASLLPAASAAQRVGEGTCGKAMQSRKGEVLPSFPS
jgi:hypothetical protein